MRLVSVHREAETSVRPDLDFVNVTLLDEKVVDFAGFVHVDFNKRACLCQSEASLTLALVQQGLLVFEVCTGHKTHHLAELKDTIQRQRVKVTVLLVHP